MKLTSLDINRKCDKYHTICGLLIDSNTPEKVYFLKIGNRKMIKLSLEDMIELKNDLEGCERYNIVMNTASELVRKAR